MRVPQASAAIATTPPTPLVKRIQTLPTLVLLAASGIALAATSALDDASSLGLSSRSGDQPLLSLASFLMAGGALVVVAVGIWLLAVAVSRWIRLDTPSILLMESGWCAAYLFSIFIGHAPFGMFVFVTLIGLVTGGSIAWALRASNPRLPLQPLLIIAAGWLIGFIIQGLAIEPLYENLTQSGWDFFAELQAIIGFNALMVVQFGIIGFFYGLIAPVIGIAVMTWQLRGAAQK